MFVRTAVAILTVLLFTACKTELSVDLPRTPPDQWPSSMHASDGHVLRVADGQVWVDDVCYGRVPPGASVHVETSGPNEGAVTVNGQVVHPVEKGDG